MDESQRPVELTRYVLGYPSMTNWFQFNNLLSIELVKVLDKLLEELSREKQILVCINLFSECIIMI